jgi:hypothetical protein
MAMTDDVKQVLAAIAENDRLERESLDRMDLIRREGIARDLRAGRRVLEWCHCPECIGVALRLGKPNPYTCEGARVRAAEEPALAAKDRSEASL